MNINSLDLANNYLTSTQNRKIEDAKNASIPQLKSTGRFDADKNNGLGNKIENNRLSTIDETTAENIELYGPKTLMDTLSSSPTHDLSIDKNNQKNSILEQAYRTVELENNSSEKTTIIDQYV
ncbi:MAG: hypothetical protein KZQ83_06695 [gamma proteobacterium symbiont of Taylorina sp.]|nr:hypothetical protein [gamma proteobacterium symbiont of Taylorina sp.]